MQTISKREQVIDLAKRNAVIRPADLDAVGLPRRYLSQLSQEGILHDFLCVSASSLSLFNYRNTFCHVQRLLAMFR